MGIKVLIANTLRPHGETGVQTYMNSLVAALLEAGYDAEVVTPYDVSPLIYIPVFAVRRFITPFSRKTGVWWHRNFHQALLRQALSRKLVNGRPTIIYAQCPVSAKAALDVRDPSCHTLALAVHFNRSQASEWRDQGLISENDWVWRSVVRLEEEVLPMADRLLYTSKFMQLHMEKRFPELQKVPAIAGINFMGLPTKKHFDKSNKKRDLVSIGSLEHRKNQVFLLQVLRLAKEMGHSYSLTIVGDGPDMHKLKEEATRLGVASQVDFAGKVPDVLAYLRNHRLLVHAAKTESFGLVLIEAMAHAMPVIAAPVGGIPEVFSDGVGGRYWSLDNPEDAATILVNILENEALLARMSCDAYNHFVSHHETAITFPKVRDFLLDKALPSRV